MATKRPLPSGFLAKYGDCHWYTRGGDAAHGSTLREARKNDLLPSVTTILRCWPSPVLNTWKIENAIRACMQTRRAPKEDGDAYAGRVVKKMNELRDFAADFGSEMHAAIRHRLAERRWPDNLNHITKHLPALEQQVQRLPTPLAVESVVLNQNEGYAGTLDLLTLSGRRGKVVLWDWKNQGVKPGKKPNHYPEWLMQMSAYARAIEGLRVDQYISVVVDRDDPQKIYPHVWPSHLYDDAWQDFLTCRDLWVRSNKYEPRTLVNADVTTDVTP
jgi:hypothetical protein